MFLISTPKMTLETDGSPYEISHARRQQDAGLKTVCPAGITDQVVKEKEATPWATIYE
jgi:hypothetical protein